MRRRVRHGRRAVTRFEDLAYDAGTCLDLLKSAERYLARTVLQADHLHAIADGGITSDDVEGLIDSIQQARVTVNKARTIASFSRWSVASTSGGCDTRHGSRQRRRWQ